MLLGANHRAEPKNRSECTILVAISIALRVYCSPWKKKKTRKEEALLYSGLKRKKKKENQVILERHDIPRALETPFLFSSENTETKQI